MRRVGVRGNDLGWELGEECVLGVWGLVGIVGDGMFEGNCCKMVDILQRKVGESG